MVARKTAGTFGSDAIVIEVQAQHDKAELLGVPFIIREAWVVINASVVEFLYMSVETENDGFKTIADSSTTGVRKQVLDLLTKVLELAQPFSIENGKVSDLKLFAANGLRVSEYDVIDRRGKSKKAKTYYIA